MAGKPEPERSLGDFDAYADRYDQAVNTAIGMPGLSVDFFTAAKIDYIRNFVTSRFGAGARPSVLDVGCGIGNYHVPLSSIAGRLAGVDVSPDSIAEARRRNPDVDYRVSEGTTIPHADGSFDLALAICVLHHVPVAMREALARDVARVLRPGGWFLIFEHNPLNPLTMRVVNRCPFDADAILLKEPEARNLLKSADFTNLTARHILTAPVSGRLQFIDRALSFLRLGSQFMAAGQSQRKFSN